MQRQTDDHSCCFGIDSKHLEGLVKKKRLDIFRVHFQTVGFIYSPVLQEQPEEYE